MTYSVRPSIQVPHSVISVLASITLAACSTPPLSDARTVADSDQVADVFVSAYPAVPWAEIAPKMEPKHNLDTATAMTKAANATRSEVSQYLGILEGGLSASPPQKSASSSTTVTDGTESRTSTVQLKPGTVPTSSGASPSAIGADSLKMEGSNKDTAQPGIDAATQLMQGTALYQLAAILDNQWSKSIHPDGYDAYLVTFQVNLQPYARDLPYDTYINLTILPSAWTQAVIGSQAWSRSAIDMPAVLTYPLVISEAMESGTVQKSVENIRQAALSLSGLVGNGGINAGVNGGSNSLRSAWGADRNSLVTVGRVSNNSLRIRLGAQYQGSRAFAMLPKSQNISVVVLVKAGAKREDYIDQLSVLTTTEFVHAETGQRLLPALTPEAQERQLTAQVVRILDRQGLRLYSDGDCGKDPKLALSVLRAVHRGDYFVLDNCTVYNDKTADRVVLDEIGMNEEEKRILVTAETSKQGYAAYEKQVSPLFRQSMREIVTALQALNVSARESHMTIPLKAYTPSAVLPAMDSMLLLVDDARAATITMRGARYQSSANLTARLELKINGKQHWLSPQAIRVRGESEQVMFEFPSLLANGLASATAPKDGAAASPSEAVPVELHVTWNQPEGPAQILRYQDIHFVRSLKP